MKGFWLTALADKIWHRPTLPHFTAVPSALAGLTSLFGMGRGGHRRYRHLNIFSEWLINDWWVVLLCRSLIKLIHNILFCLSFIPDSQLPMNYWTSELINLNIIERSKLKRKQQHCCSLSVCWSGERFIVRIATHYSPLTIKPSRRKLRAISITWLWCHHLYTCNLST